MRLAVQDISDVAGGTTGRAKLWIKLLNEAQPRTVVEVGVWRGDFAWQVLDACPSIETYYLIDPWRSLDQWNKPDNTTNAALEECMRVTLERTEFAAGKRVVLRGTTVEVIDEIPDGSLDFAYVDGDHTLRGITIDLIRVWPKMREGGWIGGDDFFRAIWAHNSRYEPTLVFPYVVHFAEAMGARVVSLEHEQFLIEKTSDGFEFIDLAGGYSDTSMLGQLRLRRLVALRAKEALIATPGVARIARRGKSALSK